MLVLKGIRAADRMNCDSEADWINYNNKLQKQVQDLGWENWLNMTGREDNPHTQDHTEKQRGERIGVNKNETSSNKDQEKTKTQIPQKITEGEAERLITKNIRKIREACENQVEMRAREKEMRKKQDERKREEKERERERDTKEKLERETERQMLLEMKQWFEEKKLEEQKKRETEKMMEKQRKNVQKEKIKELARKG